MLSWLFACAMIVEANGPIDAASVPEEPPRTLYEQGRLRYASADYGEAIALWDRAYAAIETTPKQAGLKASLLVNLAAAHEKAYQVDEDPEHLHAAKRELERYRQTIDTVMTSSAARQREHQRTEAKIASLTAVIERIPPPVQYVPEPPTEVRVRQPLDPPLVIDRDQPMKQPTPGRGLMAAGGVTTGLGLASGAMGLTGALLGYRATQAGISDPAEAERQRDLAKTYRTIGIAGAVSAAVLIPSGVVMLVVGRRRAEAPRVSAAPTLDARSAGMTIRGRF